MILEPDGEAALLATQATAQNKRGDETLLQNSPVGDSKPN